MVDLAEKTKEVIEGLPNNSERLLMDAGERAARDIDAEIKKRGVTYFNPKLRMIFIERRAKAYYEQLNS